MSSEEVSLSIELKKSVLRIRYVYPGSEFFHPGFGFFPSRIRIKEFKYFKPKKLFLSTRKYDSGCSSRILILIFYPSHPDPDPQHWKK